MTTSTEANAEWERLQAHLPEGWRELGKEMGLVREQPAQLGAKVSDIEGPLRLMLYQAGTSSSLRATAALAAAVGVLAMSSVALHGWVKKLGPYLTALLRRMVDTAAFAPAKWGGLDVIAGDGTTVQRPGSKGTTARVHYALRLADLTPRHIEVTDEHGGEMARRFHPVAGEVWLLDRCYANPGGVHAIRNPGAHIIVRYNRGTLPLYDKRGKLIDVAALLRATKDRQRAHQVRAIVHYGEERIEGRLCWLRLPEDKAEEARKRARREAEGVCDAATLEAAAFVVVFTTVLTEMTAAQVLELYRARWQIELDFKRSKSIRELDRLPNFLPETILSWICAKLLLQLVAMRVAAPPDAFPPGGVHFALLPDAPVVQAPPPRRDRRTVVRGEAGLEDRLRRADPRRAA